MRKVKIKIRVKKTRKPDIQNSPSKSSASDEKSKKSSEKNNTSSNSSGNSRSRSSSSSSSSSSNKRKSSTSTSTSSSSSSGSNISNSKRKSSRVKSFEQVKVEKNVNQIIDTKKSILLNDLTKENLTSDIFNGTKKLEETSKDYIEGFYAQLAFLDTFFKSNGIRYWLNGGTLLGQVRSEKIIPWASCNSIGVLEQDGIHFFTVLQKAALEAGFQLWNSVHGLKLRCKTSPVATDIYYYSLSKDDYYILSSARSRKQWPKDYFKVEELNQLQLRPFGSLLLFVPNNPERYLSALYTKNFLSVARYSSYNHLNGTAREFPLLFFKI